MKVSMSNREYSKVRKHFRTMFKNGDLTKEVWQSEEYLNFEKEENKRKEARDVVKSYLKTMKDNFYFVELKRKIDIYNMKFFSFITARKHLKEYIEELYKNKKIDMNTLTNFYGCGLEFDEAYKNISVLIGKIDRYNYFGKLFSKTEEYRDDVESVLLKLRRLTCDFSIFLRKLEKEVEIITKNIPKLSKKRQKEDKYEAQYKAVAKSLELEKVFSKYRYYQDKKSR